MPALRLFLIFRNHSLSNTSCIECVSLVISNPVFKSTAGFPWQHVVKVPSFSVSTPLKGNEHHLFAIVVYNVKKIWKSCFIAFISICVMQHSSF